MNEQKKSWSGRFYEDFEVGDTYQHPLGRTVTTTDNLWFTLLTQNTAPVHVDHQYASQTEFGKPLVNSTFTLALVTGQTTCYNQQGQVVITFKRTVMVYKRGYAPHIVRLQPGESQ